MAKSPSAAADGLESKGEEEGGKVAATDSTVPETVPMIVRLEAGEETKLLLRSLVEALPKSYAIPANWATEAEEVADVREVLSSLQESYSRLEDDEDDF